MDLTRDPPHIYLEFQSQIHFIKMPSTHSKRRVMKVVLTIDSKGKKGTSILDIRIIWNKKKKKLFRHKNAEDIQDKNTCIIRNDKVSPWGRRKRLQARNLDINKEMKSTLEWNIT